MMTVAQGVSARIEGSVMRRCLVVFCLLAFVTPTSAQDFETPTLRGSSPFIPAPPQYTPWAGVYAGGQIGLASADMDLRNAFDSVRIFDPGNLFTAPLGSVSGWATFGQKVVRSTSYGAFVGYNTQWSDAIIGIEANYNRSSLFGSSSDSRCQINGNPSCSGAVTLGDGNAYNVNSIATASARITDYGTIRMRGAWAYENFLPFGTIGVAVARAEVIRTATANATPVDPLFGTAFVHTETDRQTRFTWGWSASAGVDYLIMPNVFVRGEYEFIQLNPVANVRLSVSTARIGGGLKF